jgi:DNA-binding transcriptional LysR family regulator
MNDINLKLLTIFDEIYKTKSVSQSADNLGMTQPAISMSLAKLRHHFHDPLFVRTSNGMEPTPHANDLVMPLRQAHELVMGALGHHSAFDPKNSDRRFKIATTDIGQIVLIPKLLARLKKVAPGVRLELIHISEDTPKHLEAGAVDLAIGFMSHFASGFYQQQLFKERFVCTLRTDHPRVGKALSIEQFAHEEHLEIFTSGTGHNIIERTLDSMNIKRKIGLRVPNFLGIPTIVANTDMLVTVPERLGQIMANVGNIRTIELPFDIAPYPIKQHWHERYSQDPSLRWMRALNSDIFWEDA